MFIALPMLEVLAQVIPLDLAATLSPGILALTIFLLSKKINPKKKTIALLIGSFLAGLCAVLIGYFIGQSDHIVSEKTLFSGIIDFLISILFIGFAIKIFTSKDRKIKHFKHLNLFHWSIIGFIISITNFDAVLFILAASREISSAATSGLTALLLLFLGCIFFVMPIILPLSLYLIVPESATKLCKKINYYVVKYGIYIVFCIFLVFGLVFLKRAILIFF